MTDHKYGDSPLIITDLRSKLPDIRDQGTRPLCLVFATSDANSHANSLCSPLSTEYLAYYSYKNSGKTDFNKGLNIHDVEAALRDEGQPEENVHPYILNAKSAEKPSKESLKGNKIYYGNFKNRSRYFIDIEKTVSNGTPVLICSEVTVDMLGGKVPAIYSESQNIRGNHAMIICGTGILKGDRLLMIKNSWGKEWANEGFAWITESYVNKHVFNAEIIEQK